MKIYLPNKKVLLVNLFILFFAISPAFAFDEQSRNILLVAFMTLSLSIILLIREVRVFDFWLAIFILLILIFPYTHQTPVRWSTVFYSILFCLTFLSFIRVFHNAEYSLNDFLKILKFVITAYFVVLVIQQFCVLVGLPIINERAYFVSEPWKLNSLSAEPSWSGRIVGLLSFCYFSTLDKINGFRANLSYSLIKERKIWFIVLWTQLTMLSVTAVLFVIILCFRFFRPKAIFQFLIITISLFILVNMLNIETFIRLKHTFAAFLSFDVEEIIKADHSGSSRIIPTLVLSKLVTIFSLEGLTGHGVDFVRNNVDFGLGYNVSGGGFLGFWLEYGFIPFVVFITFSLFVSLDRKEPLTFIFWYFLIFSYGINSQIPWLAMLLLYINKTALLHNSGDKTQHP